jgi:hypothetical protein
VTRTISLATSNGLGAWPPKTERVRSNESSLVRADVERMIADEYDRMAGDHDAQATAGS